MKNKKSAPCNQAKCTFVYTTWDKTRLTQYIAVMYSTLV